jgi:beta-glucosidase/6-phospho-beta-glucosidase/beta-galactosidase
MQSFTACDRFRALRVLAGLFLLGMLLAVAPSGCKHGETNEEQAQLQASVDGGVRFNKKRFFFGLATAPAHVEDNLHDAWLDFARSGGVVAWKNQAVPEQRLNFWTDPDTEIALAADTGVEVFRMGVDWGRLVSRRGAAIDRQALARYKEIVGKVRAKRMRVMMTLFHHSLPRWALDKGGWTNPETKDAFVEFSKEIVKELEGSVDYWVTFNEPAVFAGLVHAAGIWPGGGGGANPGAMIAVPGAVKGDFYKAVDNMTEAHNILFDAIHEIDDTVADGTWGGVSPAIVGIAHNVGHHVARSESDLPGVLFSRVTMTYLFLDDVIEKLDFIGMNYYGSEMIQGASIAVNPYLEYSESGRIVNPNGLYRVLMDVHNRYNKLFVNRSTKKQIPFIISENGISDGDDVLRPAYLIEHLRAIDSAMQDGVPILGYVFWTISDNWEWADGYCPKFGLVGVDRADNLRRTKRPSYDLFTRIVKSSGFTEGDATAAWQVVQDNKGKPRSFCRNIDGKTSADTPFPRDVVATDWRFAKDKPLELPGGGPFELSDELLNVPTEQLKKLEEDDGVKLLTTFFRAFGGLELEVLDKRSITFKLKPGTYLFCKTKVNDVFPIHLYFDNKFALKDITVAADKTWTADVEGIYLRARIPMPYIRMDQIRMDKSLARFKYSTRILGMDSVQLGMLSNLPPFDLLHGAAPKCSIRSKGPGAQDFL